MPAAARAPMMPGTLSSITTQRAGATPIRSAACRNRSGAGLPCIDLLGGKQMRREARVQPGAVQREGDPLQRAAGGDADRLRERVERLLDMRDRLPASRRNAQHVGDELRLERIVEGTAELGLDLAPRLAAGAAEETLGDLFGGDRIAVPGQRLGMDAAGNHFAVDQHAVAIEDDEIAANRGRDL